MKKQLLATSTALALAAGSSVAVAGGIQIDPTGSGNIANSVFVVDPGNSFGNALAQGAFPQPSATPTASTFYMQNALNISGTTGIASSRLTFVMSMPILASSSGATVNFDFGGGSGVGAFALYYEDNTTGGGAANKAAGTGFSNDILLATGSVSLTAGASFAYTIINGTLVPLASNDATPTVQGTGSSSFDIDFTFKDPLWVVNDLTGLTIDMDLSNTLSTPFFGAGLASSSFAEAGAGAIAYGADGNNDFLCGISASCDMQYMANTTLNFRGAEVPEPGTIGLIGAALGLAGFSARRRRKVA